MNYWLMKSEPETFSVQKLASKPKQTEMWDGVRNYQARNFMKTMQVGDRAFFYHSSCKVPGIAGLVRIAREAYLDPTAQDDPRGPWYAVDVQLEEIFSEVITLDLLRQQKELQELTLLRKGNRLSVMPLTEHDFHSILRLRTKGEGGLPRHTSCGSQ